MPKEKDKKKTDQARASGKKTKTTANSTRSRAKEQSSSSSKKSKAIKSEQFDVGHDGGHSFSIVGIGASAGGLDAIEEFFGTVSNEMGMAFVLVTHKAHGKDYLAGVLQSKVPLPIVEVKDGIRVEPGKVYVCPADPTALIKGRFQILPHKEPVPIIDYFFRSLAAEARDRAIAVVLSGMGTDGTLGVRAVKSESGMVMAQRPDSAAYSSMPESAIATAADSAAYSSMPESAIATAAVDYVLPPGEMPAQLKAYVQSCRFAPFHTSDDMVSIEPVFFLKILG